MHVNNLGQSCDGSFCLDCGKCDSCSTKSKRPVAILTKSHTPHRYMPEVRAPQPVKKVRAKSRKTGATV